MTVALRSPNLLGSLIPVDNAPVDANLKSDFRKYLEGMREIEEARVGKQAEADQILQRYEGVCTSPLSGQRLNPFVRIISPVGIC